MSYVPLTPSSTKRNYDLCENTPPTTPLKKVGATASPPSTPPKLLGKKFHQYFPAAAGMESQPPAAVQLLPVPQLKPLQPTFKVKLTPKAEALVVEIQKQPLSKDIHVSVIQAISVLISETATPSIYYKQLTPLSDNTVIADSFTIVPSGSKTHAYVRATNAFLGEGSTSKATKVFRLVLENNHCLFIDEAVKHRSHITFEILHRIHSRITATHLFKDIPGVAEYYDMVQYTTAKGKDKFVIYYKYYPDVVENLFKSWFNGAPSPQKKQETFEKVANSLGKTLHAIHQKGYIHRDIKTSNLLAQGSELFVSDFDLAALIGKRESAGTLEYTAPEILYTRIHVPEYIEFFATVRAAQAYSQAVDMYSLGVVLHEAYFGKLPPLSQFLVELLQVTMTIEKYRKENTPVLPELIERANCRSLKCKAQFEFQLSTHKEQLLNRKGARLLPPKTPAELIIRLLSMNPDERPTAEEVANFKVVIPNPQAARPPELFG